MGCWAVLLLVGSLGHNGGWSPFQPKPFCDPGWRSPHWDLGDTGTRALGTASTSPSVVSKPQGDAGYPFAGSTASAPLEEALLLVL